MLNSKHECWIVDLNFGGDITLYRRGRQVVFVKLDSPGHAGPALSLPGTFVNKKYIYPKHAFPPPQTPLFAPKHRFSPQTPLFIHQTPLWPKYGRSMQISVVWKVGLATFENVWKVGLATCFWLYILTYR